MEKLNMSLNCHQSGILRQLPGDVGLKKYFVTLLENFGTLSYTIHTLEDLDAKVRAEIAKNGSNSTLEDVLDELSAWRTDTGEKHPEIRGSCFVMSNFSNHHVWLVANSYLLLLLFWVPQRGKRS